MNIKRLLLQFVLIAMFALTQAGIITHEISHLKQSSTHSQSDKSGTADAPCSLCVAYAQAAHGAVSNPAFISAITAIFAFALFLLSNSPVSFHAHYSARAPPIKTLKT